MEITKVYYALVAVDVVAGLLTFYFLTYKPAQIRANCVAEAEFSLSAIKITDDAERQQFIDGDYRNCIHRFGLEK